MGGTAPFPDLVGRDDSRITAEDKEGSKSLHASGSESPVCVEFPETGGDGRGGGSSSVGSSSGLPSEALPPEVFYSIKLMTGKDAVGTLSGPGTLGIEKRINGDEGGGSGGLSDSGAVAGCGASGVEEKRSAVKTLVEAALSWGRGEAAGRGVGGKDARGASTEGE